MNKQHLKYTITIPLGIVLFILMLLFAVVLSIDLSEWFYYLLMFFVVIPTVVLGAYLDRKFKVAGGLAKAAKAAMVPQVSGDYVPCPHCKQPVKKGLEFCSYCGTKIVTEIVVPCPNCKQEMKVGVLFCTACGTKMSQ
jgi:hypothetical protein